MRKLTLLIAVLAVAVPSVANAKTKKAKSAKHAPAAQTDPNANGRKLVYNGFMQLFVPMQSMTKK